MENAEKQPYVVTNPKNRWAIADNPSDLPYQARARFIGSLELLCPKCGTIQTHRIAKGTWKITCPDMHCGKKFGISLRLLDLRGRTRPGPPIDYIFPEVETQVFGNKKRCHTSEVTRESVNEESSATYGANDSLTGDQSRHYAKEATLLSPATESM